MGKMIIAMVLTVVIAGSASATCRSLEDAFAITHETSAVVAANGGYGAMPTDLLNRYNAAVSRFTAAVYREDAARACQIAIETDREVRGAIAARK
jgi:hypothetical protein